MSAIFKYILDFKANTEKVTKEVGGLQGLLKGAAVAAVGMFAVDKVMEAAAAVAAYAQEISNTTSQIKTLTGLQGSAATTMAGQVTAISKAYGVEVNEAIKTSNVMMKVFGSTSKEAFDLLNLGMSGAANANGDLMEQVSEYSPHFKEAGLNATEMFAVISAGAKEGVFNDKAADAIKEGSIRMREMTQSTKDALKGLGLSSSEIQEAVKSGSMTSFEAMQLVSNKLKEFPQQAPQVGAALADIFGGPGEDAVNFIRTLGDLDTSMAGIMATANKAQMKYTESLAEFHKVGAVVFGGTGELMTKMKTFGVDAMNAIIKGTVSVINYFIDLYNESAVVRGVFEAVGFAVKTVFNYIGMMFKDLLAYFSGIGKVIKAIFTGDWSAIGDIIKETFSKAGDNAAEFGKKTAENFSKGVANTLTPREKIKIISFDTEAAAAGASAASSFAGGFAGGAKVRPIEKMATMKSITTVAPVKNSWDTKNNDFFAKTEAAPTEGLMGMGGVLDSLKQKTDDLTESVSGLKDGWVLLDGEMVKSVDTTAIVIASLNSGLSSIGQSIGDLMSGTATVSDVFDSLLGIVGDFIKSFGEAMIAAGTAGIALKAVAMNPYLAVAAGVALVALSSVVANAVQGQPNTMAMANGGILYGPTNVLAGEYPGARSNPEVIAPLSKLQSIIGDRNGGMQMVQVEVVGSISGDTIRLSQKRADRKRNQFN
jgi:hypothetical protein